MENNVNISMKKELTEKQIRELIDRAMAMLQRSYIPYSHFAVGAALLAKDGRIFTGCNIENAAYSPSVCAERTAFFKAISEGATEFDAIAIVGGKDRHADSFCPPCGVCRQVMMEWCRTEEFQIITAVESGAYQIHTLAEYLPDGFGPGNLA